MRHTKIISISMPEKMITEIDNIVRQDPHRFRNRSHAFCIMTSAGLNEHRQGREVADLITKLFGG